MSTVKDYDADEDIKVAVEAITTQQYLTFIMQGEEYGVDILAVQEIRGWESATPVPNSPSYIKGVINLRGTIVPIIDLRGRFDLSILEYGPETVVIVLKIESDKGPRIMGIIVDAISDVYDVPLDEIKRTGFGDNKNYRFIKGLATVNENMVILLKLEKFLILD
jgi:purine-binding chemotaxis protein CheW